MQLGSFLDSAKSKAAVTRPVKFKVGAKNASAQPTSVEIEAVLAYVDEEERGELRVEAASHLALKFKGKPIPDQVQRDEEILRLLALALRDKSDPAKPLASGGVAELRPVLIRDVAGYLADEYQQLIAAEYLPPSPDDVATMKDEAAGK